MPADNANPPAEHYRDPRMRGFRTRATLADACARIDQSVCVLDAEPQPVSRCCGRVLAAPVLARTAVPPFDRAAMDGYALIAAETFGAHVHLPACFDVIGNAFAGHSFEGAVACGQAVEISTGAPIPTGADAVVPVETTRRDGTRVLVTEPVTPGRHVGRAGEDITPGTAILQSGRVLRPQDLGILSALAETHLQVIKKPRVSILITGDEVLSAGSPPRKACIADMNSPMLAALVERDGGIPIVVGPLPDRPELLWNALRESIATSDLVLISGGSSIGPEDHAPSIVATHGELLIHGIALRPASPTGFGIVGRTLVFLLPGNPASCLCAYDFLAARAVRGLGGRPTHWPYRETTRLLAEKLVSAIGRVDYCRIRIENDQVLPLTARGASILSSTTRADGFVIVPLESEGYPAGATVTVWLYDS